MATLQFEAWPPCSISALFWQALADRKLSDFKTGAVNIRIRGFYHQATAPSTLVFTTESLESEEPAHVAELGGHHVALQGRMLLADTLDAFKALDRATEALKVAQSSAQAACIANIDHFVLFAFADVKRFRFYHQIAYPVLLLPHQQITFSDIAHESLVAWSSHDPFQQNGAELHFADTVSTVNVPGWPLRQLLVNRIFSQLERTFKVTCVRPGGSFSMLVTLPEVNVMPSAFAGWERSAVDPSKVAPVRMTDISAITDPLQIARQAAELNLKLMKWRLVPNLDLRKQHDTSCLLLGAGTLGCNVTRILLGWGFRNITLVDNGRVSYSNPVRQSLFTFEDARNGRAKATAAAERALQIDPNANVRGIELAIPMPGHPDTEDEELRARLDTIEALIQTHDAVFLLTDSRESRWLPSVLGRKHQKIVITVGLGFDSFVVMRHGMGDDSQRPSCYFCHDVVGPTDSLTGRSLDQQCTVTRPGLSHIAAANAVELLVSLLQHVDQDAVPADASGLLGRIPHQIRGNMSNFDQLLLSGPAFVHCTACSDAILSASRQDAFSLVKAATGNSRVLEDISGLTAMKQATEDMYHLSVDTARDKDDSDDDFVSII